MCENHGASQKALDAIKHLYVQINNLTLDTDLLARLYEAKVITFNQQKSLQRAEAEAYMLWEIIEGALKIDMISQFDKLLEVMNVSDDSTTKGIAKQLSEAAGRPICTTPVQSESAPSKPTVAFGATTVRMDGSNIHEEQKTGVEICINGGNGGGAFSMFHLLEYMECVCHIETPKKSKGGATGFVANVVIGGKEVHLIITCHCAIPDEATAKSSAFRFNHIDDEYEAGKIKGTDLFNMKDKWFWTNEDLRYTAIKLDREKLSNVTYARDEEKKMEISGIPLHPTNADMPFDEGHMFTIIQQTPTMKLCEGSCQQKKDENSAMLKYRMCTYNGSGGSPVFKECKGKLSLIAMHIGKVKSAKFNCGVLITEVIKDLKGKKHSSMLVDPNFILESE